MIGLGDWYLKFVQPGNSKKKRIKAVVYALQDSQT